MKSVLPESGVPSSEPGRMQSLESVPTLSGSGEAGVSFDLPAQADTLHCANKVMKPPLLACLPFFFFKEKQTRTICMFLLSSSVTQDTLTPIPHLKEVPLLSFGLLTFLPSPLFCVYSFTTHVCYVYVLTQ